MNKLTKVLLILAMILVAAGPYAFAQKVEKIGYVDLSRLFDEYYKTQEYDQVLEKEHQEFEKLRNEKIEKIRESQGKLALLQEDAKATLEAEIEKMKAELLEYDRQEKTTLTKNRNEKIREILLEIEKIVSTYAEGNGFSVILN